MDRVVQHMRGSTSDFAVREVWNDSMDHGHLSLFMVHKQCSLSMNVIIIFLYAMFTCRSFLTEWMGKTADCFGQAWLGFIDSLRTMWICGNWLWKGRSVIASRFHPWSPSRCQSIPLKNLPWRTQKAYIHLKTVWCQILLKVKPEICIGCLFYKTYCLW